MLTPQKRETSTKENKGARALRRGESSLATKRTRQAKIDKGGAKSNQLSTQQAVQEKPLPKSRDLVTGGGVHAGIFPPAAPGKKEEGKPW